MRFWQFLAFSETEQLPEIACAAEEVGFHGVLLGDHLVFPRDLASRYPYSPDGRPGFDPDSHWPDPWVAIGAMASVTRSLRFGTSIYILPLRSPFQVAKSVSTAAVLSRGRVVLGAGAGWMREEFDLMQVAFEGRGRRYDEMIEVLRRLLRGGMVEYHGECFDFEAVQMSPVPEDPVPIYVGGISEPALRRAGRLADGWIGTGSAPEEIPGIVEALARHRRSAGREHAPFDVMLSIAAAPDVDLYRRVEEMGVTDIVHWPFHYVLGPRSSVAAKRRAMQDYAERILVPMHARS